MDTHNRCIPGIVFIPNYLLLEECLNNFVHGKNDMENFAICYNKLNILSLKHLEEMIMHFDENGNRYEDGGLKLLINNSPNVDISDQQINYQNQWYLPLMQD